MIGRTISHYKILEKIGEGGMGVVYKAKDTKLNRIVALKFLPAELTDDSEAVDRFINEALAASALDHANICTIHEIDETNERQLFLCLAYYEGQTLKEKLNNGPLSTEEALDITVQIVRGLQRAHEAGIIHRDIKPSNIIITNRGEVKIIDFGIAKLAGKGTITKSGTTLGTVAYMAPEQIHGETVDHRADIWSLGVTLFEMLTGKWPFRGDNEAAVIYSILKEEPEQMKGLKTGIPKELERIAGKCLAKSSDERYQNVEEMLGDLKTLANMQETGITKQPLNKAKPLSRRSKFLYIAIIFFVLLVVCAGIYFQLLRDKEHEAGITSIQRTETSSATQWQNSIAVLPFKNVSLDQQQEHFCFGMTEQLITNLSYLQDLKVIARTSVMKFKDTEKTISEIAEELQVAHILEGSIRKSGNRIRVTVKLIQANEGNHVWVEEYDRDLEDIFTVQDDVSEAIARNILTKFAVNATEKLKPTETMNVIAYEYYLKGKYLHFSRFYATNSEADFRKSESMFQQAIKLDSNYALAYAGLADLYDTRGKDFRDLAKNHIDTAFRLNPNIAYVNVVKGIVYGKLREIDKSYESYKSALEINPNDPHSNFGMRYFLSASYVGAYYQGIKFLTKAIELDPLEPSYYVYRANDYVRVGNFDQAMVDYHKALRIEPEYNMALGFLAILSFKLKRYKEAEAISLRMKKNNRVFDNYLQALLSAVKGHREEALQFLEASGRSNIRYYKIIIYSLLGLKGDAIKILDKKPFHTYLIMLNNPFFDILRDSEEFKVALQKAKETYEENLRKYEDVFQ